MEPLDQSGGDASALRDRDGSGRSASSPRRRNSRSSLKKSHFLDGTYVSGGVDDMIKLGELTEENILQNLKLRYIPDKSTGQFSIYTYTGSILVAINPYRPLVIYGRAHIDHYSNKRLGDLPPHIFAVADNAYHSMISSKQDQICIVSGESGAGKTESSKQFLRFLAAVSAKASGTTSWIEKQILEADHIFESIGCAVTVRNNNSSRFGKYFDIKFDQRSGLITGAVVDTYLLEQSRIVQHAKDERNYHIFYRMLTAASSDLLSRHKLQRKGKYTYLEPMNSAVGDFEDEDGWASLVSAMQVMLFKPNEQESVCDVLAAVLHLGNTLLTVAEVKQGLETSAIANMSPLRVVEELIGIPVDKLADMLTNTVTFARGESISTPSSIKTAVTVRDSFAKAMYSKLFDWIVQKVADVLRPPKDLSTKLTSIGTLDIYGFEVFDTNSFEQLCINFWNEHMQQYFIAHIFKLEQQQYSEEGIDWKNIDFTDNQETLNLLSESPNNLFAILDDETKVGGDRTDHDLLEKFGKLCAHHSDYLTARLPGESEFGIRHFAGPVYYTVKGFLEKNRDTFSTSMLMVVADSKNEFFKGLFSKTLSSQETSTRTRKRAQNVSVQFKSSLKTLIKRLQRCRPFFVRCIKPNEMKKPNAIDDNCVLRQLRYCGILATIEIRKMGFPYQRTFSEFCERYSLLASNKLKIKVTGEQDLTRAICELILGAPDKCKMGKWVLGKTRVFMKDAHDHELERRRNEEILSNVLLLQRILRGCIERKRFVNMKNAMVTIVNRLQAYCVRKKFYDENRIMLERIRARKGDLAVKSAPVSSANVVQALETSKADQPTSRRDGSVQKQRLQDLSSPLAIAGEYDPQTFELSKEQYLRKEKRVQKLKSEIVEVVTALSELPQLVPEEIPMAAYAAAYFNGGLPAGYTSTIPTSPILARTKPGQESAALAAWSLLLVFTGDIIVKKGGELRPGAMRKTSFKWKSSKKIRKPSKREQRRAGNAAAASLAEAGASDAMSTGSSIQKIRQFIRFGQDDPELQDELFCQVAQQICSNPSDSSLKQCWIMFCMCAACFRPSEELVGSLLRMVAGQPKTTITVLCEQLIRQNMGLGARRRPPSWIEFQAARHAMRPEVTIALPNHTEFTTLIAARQSVSSVCLAISESLGIRDSGGWTLFVDSTESRHAASTNFVYLLDAVSDAETAGEAGGYVMPWKLAFRRAYFPPWHEPKLDPVASAYYFDQIMAEMAEGFIEISSEARLVDFMAKRYYVEFGPEVDNERLVRLIPNWLPRRILASHPPQWWCKSIGQLLTTSVYATSRAATWTVMANVARLARNIVRDLRWTSQIEFNWSGGASILCEIIIDHTGIRITSKESTAVDLELPFYQILWAELVGHFDARSGDVNSKDTFAGFSIQEKYLRLQCFDRVINLSGNNVVNVAEEIKANLYGLRELSRIGVAMRNSPEGGAQALQYTVGDVLLFADIASRHQDSAVAENSTTGAMGIVKTEDIHILATLVVPEILVPRLDPAIFEAHIKSVVSDQEIHPALANTVVVPVPAFIAYAKTNFHTRTTIGAYSGRLDNEVPQVGEPSPVLHKSLLESPQHADAVRISRAVARYMSHQTRQFTNIKIAVAPTDAIIQAASTSSILANEVFCQIFQQLFCTSRIKRACELLWLCSNHVQPSNDFYPALSKMIQELLSCRSFPATSSRPAVTLERPIFHAHTSIIHEVIERIDVSRKSRPRLYPPHACEVAFIQNWGKNRTDRYLEQTFKFSNGAETTAFVDSRDTVPDVLYTIAQKTGICESQTLGILVNFHGSTGILKGDQYFWDAVREQEMRLIRKNKSALVDEYTLTVVRLLWHTVRVGENDMADELIHFEHERQNYIRGYHSGVSVQDVPRLAVLLHHATQVLSIDQLIPAHAINSKTSKEWQREFNREFAKEAKADREMHSAKSAKLLFLQSLETLPTFGATLFPVLQTATTQMPSDLLLAVSTRGLSLHDKMTGEFVPNNAYFYSDLLHWSCTPDHFHINVKTSSDDDALLLLQTEDGEYISNLIEAYTK